MRIIPISALLLSAGMAQPTLDLTLTEPPSYRKLPSSTKYNGEANAMNPYPAPAAPN